MVDASALQPPEGLYFDELSKIRLLDTEKLEQTEELREQCKVFVESKLFLSCRTFAVCVHSLTTTDHLAQKSSNSKASWVALST